MPRTRVGFEMRQKARALRVHATRAEGLLWAELRLFKAEGVKFRRQAPVGPYVVDFICFDARPVVEVDGDWHETEKAKRHDANRDAYLRSLGFKVMRVDEPDVIHSAWHVAQAAMRLAHGRGDPTRPRAAAISALRVAQGVRSSKSHLHGFWPAFRQPLLTPSRGRGGGEPFGGSP